MLKSIFLLSLSEKTSLTAAQDSYSHRNGQENGEKVKGKRSWKLEAGRVHRFMCKNYKNLALKFFSRRVVFPHLLFFVAFAKYA